MKRPYAVPVTETKKGRKRERAYHLALGEFVDMFAKLEAAIQRALWHYAGTRDYIGPAVFSGVRVEQGTSLIKRVLAASKAPQSVRDEIEYLFQQVGIINGARNDILHFGAHDVAEGRGTVTNVLLAHLPERVTEFPISPEILGDMTADLRKIIIHLLVGHMGRPRPRDERMIQATLQSSWRYKHRVRQTLPTKKAAKSQPVRKRDPTPPRQP